jgi:hypothetical protein
VPISTKVTFAREVRAILSARCVTCHSRGGSAPMPLTTYDEVRPWARAIKEQAVTRRMPKWHAARGFGTFDNDPTLTPFEIALLVSWVDGGLPRGTINGDGAAVARRAEKSTAADVTLSLPAGTAEATRRVPARWVTGWTFEPGEPLITAATFSLPDGTLVGNWVAGDGRVGLPADTAIEVTGRLRIALHRRARTDYERPYTERPSVLRLTTRTTPPRDRVWTARGECRTIAGAATARAIAIRPLLERGQSSKLAVERIGAPPLILGWFRDFDPAYPRTYWLQRPLEFGPDVRLSSDAACQAALVLRAPR